MPKTKKTWASKQSTKPTKSWELIDHLIAAVVKTCQRQDWDMLIKSLSDDRTFCKIEAWLPSGYGYHEADADVFFDLETPGKIFRLVNTTEHFHTSGEHSAQIFIDALAAEIGRTLRDWMIEKGAEEAKRVKYLLTGKIAENSASPIVNQTKKAQVTPSQSQSKGAMTDKTQTATMKLRYVEKKILEVYQTLVKEGLHPSDEEIAARLPQSRKGQAYSRETVNRIRQDMRRRDIEV